MRKVLIANRGEIAVRVLRACRDAGLASVAVYGELDIEALHVTMADEAFALGGQSAAESYLDVAKILRAAADAGADAVHPGYGFLAENAGFAREVIAAGLTWIGPPPGAIDALGDKTSARYIARKVGAPLSPGTDGPASGPREAAAFAAEHGLPIAIKAAYGGGGRGLKVARTIEQIPDQFESAVREAVAAFGRGDCFVERYLDRPRHVETQCLADTHGNVVVVGTRDCSLQRRHQKVVEEAPAPFLTAQQETLLRESSRAILREAGVRRRGHLRVPDRPGRHGVVPGGEHQAPGGAPGDRGSQRDRPGPGDVPDRRRRGTRLRRPASCAGTRSSSGSTPRIPARNFLPAPGTITAWQPPSGPGVRLDAGYGRGNDGAAGVRLADRQADRHRRRPAPGAGSGPAGRWPSSRSAGCRPCCRSTVRW